MYSPRRSGNPCNTWLTPDADTRAAATQRAMELSAVGEAVVEFTLANKNYTNFDLRYVDYPVVEIIEWVERAGGDPSTLVRTAVMRVRQEAAVAVVVMEEEENDAIDCVKMQ